MERVVIIGNSGSGKTTLGKELGARWSLPVVHLDQLFWATGSYSEKRPPERVHEEIEQKKMEAKWIVEGVFGELAERFLDRADYLIWLNLPWPVCHAGLQARGPSKPQDQDEEAAKLNYQNLLVWAENYWVRTDLRSAAGHKRIFDGFAGGKAMVDDRKQLQSPGSHFRSRS